MGNLAKKLGRNTCANGNAGIASHFIALADRMVKPDGTVALVLPVAICVVAGVGHLLVAMQDTAAGAVLGHIALALGVLWGIDLILLLVLLAVHTLADSDQPPTRDSGE
ncbi:MAG: hypothetical protein IIA67_02400 [Planctomycetes bacterium]|nr:hypothetical protein [Planctomycetota bacterium]